MGRVGLASPSLTRKSAGSVLKTDSISVSISSNASLTRPGGDDSRSSVSRAPGCRARVSRKVSVIRQKIAQSKDKKSFLLLKIQISRTKPITGNLEELRLQNFTILIPIPIPIHKVRRPRQGCSPRDGGTAYPKPSASASNGKPCAMVISCGWMATSRAWISFARRTMPPSWTVRPATSAGIGMSRKKAASLSTTASAPAVRRRSSTVARTKRPSSFGYSRMPADIP